MEAKPKKTRHKLSKNEILDYYREMAYPKPTIEGYVPPDLKLKAFERYLQWMGVKQPATVVDGGGDKTQKWVLEIRTQE